MYSSYLQIWWQMLCLKLSPLLYPQFFKVLERLNFSDIRSQTINLVSLRVTIVHVQQLLCFLYNVSSTLDTRSQVDVTSISKKHSTKCRIASGLLFKLKSLGIGDKLWK